MNDRVKTQLQEKLIKYSKGEFNKEDLELTLVKIRDYADQHKFKLLLEFGNFVAHPDRDKGVTYEEVDIVYSKFKYQEIQAGEQLDYTNIERVVFELLFDKGIRQISDNYLKQHLGKSAEQLVNYIKTSLVTKSGGKYSVKGSTQKEELKEIQSKTHIPPHITQLNQATLIDEIKICFKQLSNDVGFNFNPNVVEVYKEKTIAAILDLVQSFEITLHDGEKASCHIAVSDNNTLYQKSPNTDNLNICLFGIAPIAKSFLIFSLLQTGLTVGNNLINPASQIIWKSPEKRYGILRPFKAIENKLYMH
jgi:hypothetical protein